LSRERKKKEKRKGGKVSLSFTWAKVQKEKNFPKRGGGGVGFLTKWGMGGKEEHEGAIGKGKKKRARDD